MMKKMLLILAAVAILAALVILPTLGGKRIDDPRMLMANGILYIDTHTEVPEPQENDIIGHTTSYSKKEPRKNGQSNIGKYEVPYAEADGGLAVCVGGRWYLFQPFKGNGL